jgi:ureidoglycolate hydrolase
MSRAEIQEVRVEELSPESFLPYGFAIQSHRDASFFDELPFRMANAGFEVDGTAALYIIRYVRREMIESRFERHLTMTETRICLGAPVVVLVGGPTAIGNRQTYPELASIRAFLIRKGGGILLKRGIWHALNCFPVGQPFADCAFLSEIEAESELAKFPDSHQLKRTHVVDFLQEGRTFKVTDPEGLLPELMMGDGGD